MHIKGERFGFAPVQRIGMLNDRKVHFVKWNTHPGCEIHYIAKGRLIWEVGRQARKITVTGGNFIIIPPDVRHRAAENLGAPSLRVGIIFAHPDSPATAAGSAFSHEELKDMLSRISAHSSHPHKITDELANVLSSLGSETLNFRKHKSGDRLRMRAMCDLLLCETLRACEAQSPDEDGKGSPDRLRNVREWIDAHLSERISNETLVHISGYGRSRFFSVFYSETGMTPHNFILQERIKKAKALLKASPWKSLEEITSEAGFSSVQNLMTVFRRFVGVNPKAWRKK